MGPVAGKTGAPVAMLFGQGASISTSAYESLGQALQAAVPFPLWFGVPQCLLDTAAVPLTLKSGMSRIKVGSQVITTSTGVVSPLFLLLPSLLALPLLPRKPTVRLAFGWHARKHHHLLRRPFTWWRYDARLYRDS